MSSTKTCIFKTNDDGMVELKGQSGNLPLFVVSVCTYSSKGDAIFQKGVVVDACKNGAIRVIVPSCLATQTINVQVLKKNNRECFPILGKPIELCVENKTKRRAVKRTNSGGNATFEYVVEYTIQYNPNGASGIMESETFKLDGEAHMLKPNQFTKAGSFCLFDRWNTRPDGSGVSYADKQEFKDIGKQSKTIILYAIWVPKFWLGTAKNDLLNYKYPSYNVLKTGDEILNDVQKLKAQTNEFESILTEYTQYMILDVVHLYVKIGSGINECDYIEFRIVQVGDSQNKSIRKHDITLTFQATHALEDGLCMNGANTNKGGWAHSSLRLKMQEGGEVYEMFPAALSQSIAVVENMSATSKSDSCSPVKSQDKIWVMSVTEMVGNFCDSEFFEGKHSAANMQYQFWRDMFAKKDTANVQLQNLMNTRQNARFAHCEHLLASIETVGMLPLFESERAHNTTRANAWLRTAAENNEMLFHTLEPNGAEPNDCISMWSPILNAAVVLCFAL